MTAPDPSPTSEGRRDWRKPCPTCGELMHLVDGCFTCADHGAYADQLNAVPPSVADPVPSPESREAERCDQFPERDCPSDGCEYGCANEPQVDLDGRPINEIGMLCPECGEPWQTCPHPLDHTPPAPSPVDGPGDAVTLGEALSLLRMTADRADLDEWRPLWFANYVTPFLVRAAQEASR